MDSRKDCNIVSAGLDIYFANQIKNITDEQVGLLPHDIKLRKIHDGKGRYYEAPKTSFVEKVSLLWKVFGKDVQIVIKDTEDYFTVDDFVRFERYGTQKEISEGDARELEAKAQLVLGDEDVCRGLYFLRMVQKSPMYKFVMKVRGAKESQVSEFQKQINEFSKMMIFYEGSKKKMVRDMKINIPEWYILLHLSDGIVKKISHVYLGMYYDAYNSSRAQMLRGLKRLKDIGYIQRVGKKNSANYTLTTMGWELFYSCLSKYVFNY